MFTVIITGTILIGEQTGVIMAGIGMSVGAGEAITLVGIIHITATVGIILIIITDIHIMAVILTMVIIMVEEVLPLLEEEVLVT